MIRRAIASKSYGLQRALAETSLGFFTPFVEIGIIPTKSFLRFKIEDMKIGTKSVLFGAHCFILHPFFVFAGWWKLYGFPYDPRLWVAFIVHDLGYWGKPNMDGPEGELHPYFGARVMSVLFDSHRKDKWHDFTLYHSRFLAKKNGAQYSKLCVADKLAIALTPAWLYLPMVRATGEIKEYMKDAERNSGGVIQVQKSQLKGYLAVQNYVLKWVDEHKEIKEDTWTPNARESIDENGVWK